MEGGKQEAASKVVRISSPPVTTSQQQQQHITSVSQQISQAELKKMKITEILALLAEQTGKTFSKKTRKQQLIDTYLDLFRES